MSFRAVVARAAFAACFVAPLALSAQASVRVGGIGVLATRNAAVNNGTGSATGMLGGVEAMFRSRVIGLTVRTLDGTFDASEGTAGNGQVTIGDLRLLVGPRFFTIEGGVGRRAFTDAIATRVFNYGTAGLRISLPLGGSGYEAQLGGNAYLGGKLLNDSTNIITGFQGTTSLYYSIPKFPAYLMLGYRMEHVTVSSPNRVLPEEVSGLVLGVGLQKR